MGVSLALIVTFGILSVSAVIQNYNYYIFPTTIDTSSSDISCNVVLSVSSTAAVTSVFYVFTSPGLLKTTLSGSLVFLSGNATYGNWSGVVTIPKSSPTGLWSITTLTITEGSMVFSAPSGAFGVNGPLGIQQIGAGDSTPPSINGYTLSPSPSFSTQFSDVGVVLTFSASDDFSGISYCSSSFSYWLNPSIFVACQRSGSDAGLTAQFTCALTIPTMSPPSNVSVTRISCYDNYGRSSTVSPTGLYTKQINTVGVDLQSPTIAFNSLPKNIVLDTSLTSTTLTVRFNFTDDMSGVASCSVAVMNPLGYGSQYLAYTPSSFGLGAPLSGVLSITIPFPQYSVNGTWAINGGTCTDKIGRYLTVLLYPSQTFLVLGPRLFNPNITGVSITPTTVDTSAQSVAISFSISAVFDVTGFSSCNLGFTSNVTGTTTYVYFSALSTTYTLPMYTLPATYYVSSVSCSDGANKNTYLYTLPTVSFTQIGVGDVLPPSLLGVRFSVGTIDTSQMSASVTAFISATDDVSGLSYCSITMMPPANALDNMISCTTPNTLTRVLSAELSCTLTFPVYAAVGAWRVRSFSCNDRAQHNTQLSVADFPRLNMVLPTVNQTGPADTQPPVLAKFSIGPAVVNTLNSAVTVTAVFNVSDDVAGVSGCSCVVTRPDGQTVSSSATVQPALRSVVVAVPLTLVQSSPMGTYTVTSLQCWDACGPSKYLSLAYTSVASPYTFYQNSPGDTQAPVLTAVSMSPSVINTSASSVLVTITLYVTDDVSGVSSCDVAVGTPKGSTTSSYSCTTPTYARGTLLNGTAQCAINIPRFTLLGLLPLSYVTCRDNGGHTFTRYDVATLASPLMQVAPGDILAPTVVAATMTPTTVGTALGAATVTVSFTATDDLSGVSSCNIQLQKPDGVTITVTINFPALVLAGSATTAFVLPQASPKGLYVALSGSCSDAVGRTAYLNATQVAALTLNQTDVGSSGPPVITKVTLSTSSVDCTAGNAPMLVSVSAMLAPSALSSCTVTLTSVRGIGVGQLYASSILSTQTTSSATILTIQFSVPMYSANGTWIISNIYAANSLGQSTTLLPGDDIRLGFVFPNFTVVSVSDLVPPVVSNFSISPLRFDTSSGPVTITASFSVWDDVSGVGSCFFRMQTPDQFTTYTSNTVYPAAPNNARGFTIALSANVVIPQASLAGAYTVYQVVCSDNSNKGVTYASASLSTIGNISAMSAVQTSQGDRYPPTLVSVSLSPAQIDTSLQDVIVTVTANVTDDVSGVSSCSFAVISTLGAIFSCQSASLPRGVLSSLLTCPITVKRFSDVGVWTMYSLSCSDSIGRSIYLSSPSMFVGLGLAAPTFTQTGTPDVLPPSITAVTVSPLNVSTATSSASISFEWTVSDDVSGVAQCSASITFPSKSSDSISTSTITPSVLNGRVAAVYTLRQYATAGYYTVSSVTCQDAAGHSTTIDSSNFPSTFGKSSIGFTQYGVGDVSPPTVYSISTSTVSVNVSRAAAAVPYYVNVSDDVSGVQSCTMILVSTSYTQTCYSQQTPSVGSFLSGLLPMSCSIPAGSPMGVYTVSSVSCSDWLYNSVTISALQFSGLGITASSFTQVGAPDVSPPTIAAVTVSVSTINTLSAPVSVTFSFLVSDDMSGVSTCSAVLVNPDGTTGNIYASATSPFPLNATLTSVLTFARFSPAGIYNITSATCRDGSGKSSTVTTTTLALPSVQQTALGDTAPPTVTSVTANPKTIDASVAAVTILVSIGTTDDVSGVNYCYVYFSPPPGAVDNTLSCTANGGVLGTTSQTLTCFVTFPMYAAQGVWSLSLLKCYDFNFHSLILSGPTLTSSGYSLNIMQTGLADLQPPQILNLTMSPAAMNTSGVSVNMYFVITASDDVSGINYCRVLLSGPGTYSASATATAQYGLTSGTARQGTFVATLTLVAYSLPGVYSVTQVQ